MIEPTRPNFFLLLELNPDKPWDQALYQKALQNKIRQWSRDSMSVAKKALPAQANRALIPQIRKVMESAELREEEAREARKLFSIRYQAAHQKFEKQLMLLNLKETTDPEEIDCFIKDFKHLIPASEIQKLITIKIRASKKHTPPSPQPLDASITKNIEDRLEIIHMQTLYELLQTPRKSTTLALFQAAEDLYTHEVRKHPNAEVTARIELAGFAMNIFKTDETRARYDETLRQMTLQQLLQDITESTKRSSIKEVHPRQVLYFVKEAAEAGWCEEDALDKLKEHGRIHQWFITVPLQKTEKPQSATNTTRPVEPIASSRTSANVEHTYPPHDRVTRQDIRRRVKAISLILVQSICLIVLIQAKPDLLLPALHFLTWSMQAHLSILTLSTDTFRQLAQTLLASYTPIATLHTLISIISFLLTILINSIFIMLILTPGIPIVCILIGLVSGSYSGLKNLSKTLIVAHRKLLTQKTKAPNGKIVIQLARKYYPFEDGWYIEKQVAQNLSVTFHKLKQRWTIAADILTDWKWRRNWFIRYWVYLIKTSFQLAGLVQHGLRIEIGGLCASVYTTLLLLWDASAWLCIAFLLLIQLIYRRLHPDVLRCPDCRHDISAPIYICSTCITECPQLQPGVYGIFSYRCRGCGIKLPTLKLNRTRKKFTRLCPSCRHVLHNYTW